MFAPKILLAVMQENLPTNTPIPSDCFRQSEVEAFQTFEHQALESVNYFLWRRNAKSSFLYALELCFKSGEALLLSSGEDSDGIRIITAENLVTTATKLKELHGEALIQRIAANIQPLWREIIGAVLQEIRLTRHESGLYHNDALLFDFGETQILLEWSGKEGLILGVYDFE